MSDDSDNILNDAILRALVKTWLSENRGGDQNGPRLFVRWVDILGPDKGWQDWVLVALFSQSGIIQDLCLRDDEWYQDVLLAAKNVPYGYCEPKQGLHIWWCRSNFDGPDGPRVSDWSK